MENVKEWLNNNYGDGRGYGYVDGSGYGYDSGSGSGSGSGRGYGSGYGYDSGSGYGRGYGRGYGYGYGRGDGYVDGSGYGYDLKEFEGSSIYRIDDIPTIIEHIKDSFAKGYVINNDLTLEPCFVAKGNGYFAHGRTLKEARESLRAKIFENMDPEEVIGKFLEKFKKDNKYSGTEFFKWHHYLTGSCLMGRESFVKNHNLDINALYTVDEFIDICENDYGGYVIKQLKERWNSI